MENCDYNLSKLRRILSFPMQVGRMAVRPRNTEELRMFRARFFCISFIWKSERPMTISYGRNVVEIEPPFLEILRPGEMIDMRTPALRDETFFGYDAETNCSLLSETQSCFFTLTPRMRRLRDDLQQELGHLHAPGAADRIDLIAIGMTLEAQGNRRDTWRRHASPAGPDPRIFQIARHLELHYDKDIDLNDYIASLGIGCRTFYREWNKYFTIPPKRYLLHLRLEKSCEMLRTGETRVAEIADACGFGSAIYFIQLFRQRFGMTPGDYRRMQRPKRSGGK